MNLIRVLNAGMISAEQFRDAIFLDEQKNMNSQSVNREQNADMFRYANIWQIYLRGYYNGLSVAEPDEQFQKIYEKIFEQLMWAMGDQIDCAQDNNDKT